MSAKRLQFGDGARAGMLGGIDALADVVSITLGPRGRNVLLGRTWEVPVVSRDGFRVSREIEPEDRFQRLGAALVQQITSRTYDVVGDGATSSTVIARSLFREGVRLVASGFDPMGLKRGIGAAAALLLEELARIAVPVRDSAQIGHVATIAANGDREVGEIVARAMDRIGPDGVVSLEDHRGFETVLEFVEGMQLDRGWASPAFITDPLRREACLENALVLVHDRAIRTVREIVPVLRICQELRRPLLVVAEKIEGEALQTLLANRARAGLLCVAVESPAYTERRQSLLGDLAAVTGARVISQELGIDLERIGTGDLGSARQIVVTRESTNVIGGAGTPAEVEARARTIRGEIAAAPADIDRERLEARLAMLLGGVAIVRVGGFTDVDRNETRARFEGSITAARAAMSEGIVPGGGVALLRAARVLEEMGRREPDAGRRAAIALVRRAAEEPARCIAASAGYEPAVIVERIRSHDGIGFGFNAATGCYQDLVEAGVVDPVKVVRIGFQTAVSIAGLLLASEVAITESPWVVEKTVLDPPKATGRLRPRSGHLK